MNSRSVPPPASAVPPGLRAVGRALRAWATSDGYVWLHLFKTVAAALFAMGISMRLELSQPRIAMTTAFVLMQPMSGMVLAKSFYRVIGTFAGLAAALLLGSLFSQQPALYMGAITLWISLCIAAAVRNRHFRWYGFVLAGYTATLIGIPVVMSPQTLYMSALTRTAEVSVGIFCSAAISLMLPLSSSRALMRAIEARHRRFVGLVPDALTGQLEGGEFERDFGAFVDGIVGFEATRAFASFEDPHIRARSRRLARLNGEFMNACTRLHALHQLLRRLHDTQATPVLSALMPEAKALAACFDALRDETGDRPAPPPRSTTALSRFRTGLQERTREASASLAATAPDGLPDFDTGIELLARFASHYLGYARTRRSLARDSHGLERSVTRYTVKTNRYFVIFTFLRSVVAIGAISTFWIATGWPSGGMAVISAAVASALGSSSPKAPKFVAQMAAGAAVATVAGYGFLCFVYPAIEGFALLCAALTPAFALAVFVSTRPGMSGYGVGFLVFFCLLAGPDNAMSYAPDLLINNGIAVVVSMLATAAVFSVVFPTTMPWLSRRITHDLRRQAALACNRPLDGLHARFQSSLHELMSHLRNLLPPNSGQYRDALRWMLVTLEVGHAVIDLREDLARLSRTTPGGMPRWLEPVDAVRPALVALFEAPSEARLSHALHRANLAQCALESARSTCSASAGEWRRMQRMLSCLHIIRSALLDRDVPFDWRPANIPAAGREHSRTGR
ncbi:FUSC family protein [Burkholderia sp. WAC0059]|uniref:FUSC family protein n=1 Tax=Burkholderia sp. WAC0059 TaxID=2066022 RepID=UPI000C7F467D|nr:FUSC family protein [Burkholderia sp. WAC0059]PLZ03148.1 FUSC family protein [Burkholderia sp. WAC0059]